MILLFFPLPRSSLSHGYVVLLISVVVGLSIEDGDVCVGGGGGVAFFLFFFMRMSVWLSV